MGVRRQGEAEIKPEEIERERAREENKSGGDREERQDGEGDEPRRYLRRKGGQRNSLLCVF